MGFHINDKKANKNGGKTAKTNAGASKFIVKPTASKSAGPAKKPIKTGGTRGS